MAGPGRCLLAGIFIATCIFLLAGAKAAPQSYITEEVQARYFWNGTLSAPVTRTGYVEVSTGSVPDVLQYIRLTLTSTSGTNLQSVVAFRNVAASPSLPADRTRIFVNTTNSTEDLSYLITDQSLTPVISMRLDYRNQLGGREIVPGQNIFLFNVTLNSSQALSGASLVIQARRDTFGWNDSISFTAAYAPAGSPQLQDTDTDGFFDRLFWVGDLPPGDFNVSFRGTLAPGSNFDESLMQVSMDEDSSYCYRAQPQTFTGTAFSSRLSRGPVREGIEMIQLGTWVTRGFMKNIASNLTYLLNSWELYQVGNPVPVLSSSASTYVYSGSTEYTGWYDTGLTNKPAYFAGSFDWEVVWGSSEYRGITASNISMPGLYEMDSWPDGAAVLQSNSPAGRSATINVSARHLGHSSIPVSAARLNSTLPMLSQSGEAKAWTPSSVRVYYSNGSGTYDITAFAAVQSQPSGPGNGFVYAEIPDMLSALGHYMQQNDDIFLSFVVSSPASPAGQSYTFQSNTTLITLSGTPETETVSINLTVPGVAPPVEPGGGGGGGAPPPAPYAAIVKESADAYFVSASMVNVVVVGGVVDSGGKGIKDVKALVYAPAGSELDAGSIALRIYRNSTRRWEELAIDRDFTVIDNGPKSIGKDAYREYLIKRTTPWGSLSERTIDMLGGDRMEVAYRIAVPFGTSYMLTRLFGYNYYEDRMVFEDAYIPVRRETGKLEKIQIEEGEWMQGEAVVGKPVRWRKTFRAYNPNNVSVEEPVTAKVFQDSLSVEMTEIGRDERSKLPIRGGGEAAATWYARLSAGERKTYVMEAYTPPVLETRRDIEILESSQKSVRISANLTIENFGRERYENVTLPFPVGRDKIVAISDPALIIEDSGEDSTRIIIRGMDGFEAMNISIMYLETPPLLAITLTALKYSCTDSADATVFIVPSEADSQSYLEVEVVGPEPHLITTHAEIVDIRHSRPYEEIRIPLRISLSSFPSGKYFVYTKFNKNFGTILSDSKEFILDCPGRDLQSVSWLIVLGASLAVVSILAARVYRKRSYQKEIADLRKKVKGI